MDWDAIIRQLLPSPRIATTYLLTRDGQTKLAAGVGLFHDATNLGFITRGLDGRRFDRFYARDGQTPIGAPIETSLRVDEGALKTPRFINFSVGLERKLPASIYLRADYIEKHGSHGFTFVNRGTDRAGRYELTNDQRDRYRAVSLAARRAFKNNYELFVSYTRSSARSNAIFDFNLDRLLFSQQAGGLLPWDAPNRLISWGWLPLLKGFDLAYSLDWRTGYPFSLTNEDQRLVGRPNSRRLPSYFTLNVHAERRFRLLGVNRARRAGFNNVTDRENPSEINNNIDSPKFLTLGGVQSRAFVGRVRFLGRK
jgi:hypothetical protein